MRRKFEPTRKKKALRWCAAALVFLALGNWLLDAFYLLPAQTRWHLERSYETGHTDVAYARWDFRLRPFTRYYLSGNDDVTLFTVAHLTPLGWECFPSAIDFPETNAPYSLSEQYEARGFDRVYHLYGRIDDPAIQSLKVNVRYTNENPETGTVKIGEWSARSGREDWVTKNGHTYVLVTADWTLDVASGWGGYCIDSRVIFYDSEGAVLEATAVEGSSFSNYYD